MIPYEFPGLEMVDTIVRGFKLENQTMNTRQERWGGQM